MKSLVSTAFFLIALIGVTFFILTRSDLSDQIANPDKKRHDPSFLENRNSRAEYIAYLRKTIRNKELELARRSKAVEDRPVWP